MAAIVLALTLVLGQAQPESPATSGSGTVIIDGKTITISHAVKTTRKNLFNDFFEDPVVVLSNAPISEAEASDDEALRARAQKDGIVTVAIRFDGRPRRGQLFNVAINHAGAASTVLLPDLWFDYTMKEGRGTVRTAPREMAGHTYAADLEFAMPMPAPTEEISETFVLPPPSKTDEDRRRASQLLAQALKEGDESRALAIIDLGIDPNARDEEMGISLINWAVLMCQPPVVARLVELKADLSHERLPGMTLLEEARAACPEAVGYLKAGGAK